MSAPSTASPSDSAAHVVGVPRMVRPELRFKSATNEWPTPDTLWKPLDDEFGFTLDVCATDENAKCPRYYTRADDGLAQPWSGVCWMNPPYGREMVAWLKRANAEKANGVTTVALIPSRTNTGWWHDIVMPNEVRFVRGRPKFGNADQGLPWPLAVVVFRSNESSADTAGVAPRHATDGIPPLSAALCYPLAEFTQNTLP